MYELDIFILDLHCRWASIQAAHSINFLLVLLPGKWTPSLDGYDDVEGTKQSKKSDEFFLSSQITAIECNLVLILGWSTVTSSDVNIFKKKKTGWMSSYFSGL